MKRSKSHTRDRREVIIANRRRQVKLAQRAARRLIVQGDYQTAEYLLTHTKGT